MISQRVLENKNAQRLIEQIVDQTRQISVLSREMENRQAEIDRMRTTGQDKFANRENDLLNLALTVLQLTNEEHGGENIDRIFIEGNNDPVLVRRRRNWGEMISCLRFLYTTDPLSNNLDNATMDIVRDNTQDWNVEEVNPRVNANNQ